MVRRRGNVVRGHFGSVRPANWTNPSDFAPDATSCRDLRRRGSSKPGGPRTQWSRYAPLWLGFVLFGLAFGTGAFERETSKSSVFAFGGEAKERPVYYRRCDDARAAGAAPIRVGEPGYREELDRDRDGVACEPYVGR